MKVVKASEGVPYEAAKHFNVWSTRKLTMEKDTQRLTVSFSHFLPNGGTETIGGAPEKMYYIVEGSMIVTTQSGESTLQKGDLVYFAADEERSIRIPGNDVCTILVILVKTQ